MTTMELKVAKSPGKERLMGQNLEDQSPEPVTLINSDFSENIT